jgi:hypothetical protein
MEISGCAGSVPKLAEINSIRSLCIVGYLDGNRAGGR